MRRQPVRRTGERGCSSPSSSPAASTAPSGTCPGTSLHAAADAAHDPPAPLSRRRALLGIVGAGTAAAAAAFAGAAPAIAATTTATKRKADLYVSGNQIMAAGVKADLRGVSMGDPLFRQHRPTSDYATLVEGWKAKLVRISVLPGSFKHQRELALELLCRPPAYGSSRHRFAGRHCKEVKDGRRGWRGLEPSGAHPTRRR